MNCQQPIPVPTTTQGTAVTHSGATPGRVPAGAHRRLPARTLQARSVRWDFALICSPIRGEGATPGSRHVVPRPWTPGGRNPWMIAGDTLENRMEG
ncbi:hypothetical protein [Deinococcus aetherius]|nr:hypothetical protein [Deinococcus aetherius]